MKGIMGFIAKDSFLILPESLHEFATEDKLYKVQRIFTLFVHESAYGIIRYLQGDNPLACTPRGRGSNQIDTDAEAGYRMEKFVFGSFVYKTWFIKELIQKVLVQQDWNGNAPFFEESYYNVYSWNEALERTSNFLASGMDLTESSICRE